MTETQSLEITISSCYWCMFVSLNITKKNKKNNKNKIASVGEPTRDEWRAPHGALWRRCQLC